MKMRTPETMGSVLAKIKTRWQLGPPSWSDSTLTVLCVYAISQLTWALLLPR